MARTEPGPLVVCDAGPLIHLDELGCLDLISDFRAVLVPEQVWREVEHHRPSALSHPQVRLEHMPVDILTNASFMAMTRLLALAAGEQAALSLMRDHPNAIMLSDDGAARWAANRLGYRVHGTIGILLRAVRRGQRAAGEVLHHLRAIPTSSTLHLRPSLLADIIEQVTALIPPA